MQTRRQTIMVQPPRVRCGTHWKCPRSRFQTEPGHRQPKWPGCFGHSGSAGGLRIARQPQRQPKPASAIETRPEQRSRRPSRGRFRPAIRPTMRSRSRPDSEELRLTVRCSSRRSNRRHSTIATGTRPQSTRWTSSVGDTERRQTYGYFLPPPTWPRPSRTSLPLKCALSTRFAGSGFSPRCGSGPL